MANALIVFTPRSGSTIVGELLAYKHQAVFLDEIMMGYIRGVLRDRLPLDVKEWIKECKLYKLGGMYNRELAVNPIVSHDYYRNVSYPLVQKISKHYPIVVKFFPSAVPGVRLIEWAKENNFEIFFLTRKNFYEQLYSLFLADSKFRFYTKIKKQKKINISRTDAYLNTNKSPRVVFPPVTIPKDLIFNNLNVLQSINCGWQSYRLAYQHYGKVIYYEDSIARNDFTEFGIDDQTFEQYNLLNGSLRPTHSYKIGEQIANWDEVVEIASHYYCPVHYE